MSLPKCLTCATWVQGYTWVMPFSFINGERQPGIEECHLSCGCVLTFPSIDVEAPTLEQSEGVAIVSIKDLSGTLVLAFYDRFEECQ